MQGIRKAFPGVQALDGVDLDVRAGEVHVLLGENGAGKSTLMRILSGGTSRDAGSIHIDGEPAALESPRAAQDAGIAIIHQELLLVPELSVAENIFLGRFPHAFGVVDRRAMHAGAQASLHQLDDGIDVRAPVASLSLARQQLVEIARALSLDARVLVMDEPTSALTDRETQRLFSVIRDLTARGVAVIYISHRLEEIFAIGDRVTVLRDGRYIATHDVATAQAATLIRLMADRELDETARRPAPVSTTDRSAPRLRAEGLSRTGVLRDVSFSVRPGEIVGFAGLLGAGRTEVARALFGADMLDSGALFVDGAPVHLRSPGDAIAAGIGFVTEDRKQQGLVLDRSVRDNVSLPILRSLSRWWVVQPPREQMVAEDAVRGLRIKTPTVEQHVRTLSGGNQQKVVLAKWLATGARILLLDEPTRGVDVGAKQEIHDLVRQLAEQGTAVLLFSSELPELLSLSHRVLVMRNGTIAGEFAGESATAEQLMGCAVGG